MFYFFANRIAKGQFQLRGKNYQIETNEGNNSLHSGKNGLHLVEWDVLDQDDLIIRFLGTTDQDTVMNMTNHTYFNLDNKAKLDDHFFMIDSKGALELNEEGIPTGAVIPAIGDFNLSVFQRLEHRTFDHNFILSYPDMMELAAAAYCPTTDITLEVFTDQPGLQFYSGKKTFFAFETQHFPDSPNQSSFPSTLVTVDKPYDYHCIYRLNY